MSLLPHREHEERPWGSFDRFTRDEPSTVKIIQVAPGKRFSLQYHRKRSEFWYILTGSGTVLIDDVERLARTGDEFEVPVGAKHRVTAGEDGLWFLEIALGDFDEQDVVRLEDDFGRVSA